ncbi:hypothetical protein Y032_0470g2028 [Ancylostoma ceylanicum]|uniref:Uncharacterized protein n=1 Tax=Ancylostoma ceylanicum TaxID=53326 RepID=A0A016WWG1_9BILA|nr:hypothetical protein Y032_0470g2028 [Ancylostoma ceylanicum]
MKSKVTLTAVFVAVLIVGSTLSVILTVALTSGSVINNTPKPKVVYYAMYLGDGGGEKRISRNARSILQADNEQCSLELNKKNTISSINDMKSTNQLYSFILYTTTAKSTEPKKAMEAIRKLEGEPADSSKKEFNQTATCSPTRKRPSWYPSIFVYIRPSVHIWLID